MTDKIKEATLILKRSRFTTAFTGAGISVESGIPSFRGSGGLWEKYDPKVLDLNYFLKDPAGSWVVIKEIFYDFFGMAKPNAAHLVLARMEREGLLGRTITQNIDNLHQEAGSAIISEFHGNSKTLLCLQCHRKYRSGEISLEHVPPTCRECGGILKPDFVFFGEAIPQLPLAEAYEAATLSDVFLVIGTTGEVMPANQIPFMAKEYGATIIEVNPEPSNFTDKITDIFLQGKATEVMKKLEILLFPAALDDDQDGID
ncbi:MAG: NAD-dependent deacylase [Bacteroidetes bacterium]|nr:NAD-dependent deacylase [Bacteroidota bacterium]